MELLLKCPTCGKNEAQVHKTYGLIACQECQGVKTVKRGVEFTTESIKNQRRAYFTDIVQPYSADGILSKEWLESYGTTGIKATKKEIKNAKYIYKGSKGWWNRTKSKGGRSEEWKAKNVDRKFRKL